MCKTLEEVWSDTPAYYSIFKGFGCPAYYHVNDGKLEPNIRLIGRCEMDPSVFEDHYTCWPIMIVVKVLISFVEYVDSTYTGDLDKKASVSLQ